MSADHSDWIWIPSKRFTKGRPVPISGVVQHYTAGGNARALAKWLATDEAKVSAHILIGRDGKVYQQVRFRDKAWHAGTHNPPRPGQAWKGEPPPRNVNDFTIGIENSNYGYLLEIGGKFFTKYKDKNGNHKPYPIKLGTPRQGLDHNGKVRWWEPYSDKLIAANIEVMKRIVELYPHITAEDIQRHSGVDPNRKSDPGPLFPWDHIQNEVFGTGAAEETTIVIGAEEPDEDEDELGHREPADEDPELHYDYELQMSMIDRVR